MSSDSVALILQLLKDTFGSEFKTYYDGDPEAIPLFNLPAIIVDQAGDDTEASAFELDDITDHLVIKVVLNKRDDFDGDQVNPLNITSRKIRDYVAKLDKSTGTYAKNTVKYALRHVVFDGVTILAPTMSVEYGITPRTGDPASYATLTAEGHVNFDITYTQRTDI